MAHKLFILSTGPGGTDKITGEVLRDLNECSVVVGYRPYLEDIKEIIKNKETYTSGMTEEIDRCNYAIESALAGKTTALISNGDAGVFGMASLALELAANKVTALQIEIIIRPGVTSFLSAAAKAGAPAGQDFALISLSDRLTDIKVIEKRLQAALEADFVLGIYNPVSRTRKEPYSIFLNILNKTRDPKTPVIVASNLDRENEVIQKITVEELIRHGFELPHLNMSTMIITGNSNTFYTKNGFAITPRGYFHKYDTDGKKLKSL